jgi:ADP-ribose pyrophosphatase
MADGPFHTLNSQIVYRNPPWYVLRCDEIRLPDGSQGVYTVVERPGGVWIVPLLADGRLAIIRNYRYTVKGWVWEIPAGGLRDGIPPEDMARLELAEEIGGAAQSIEPVGQFYTMPGIGDEVAHIYLARGVTLGEPHLEPTEVIERHVLPLDDVLGMIERGEMSDGPSALAILLALPKLRQMADG